MYILIVTKMNEQFLEIIRTQAAVMAKQIEAITVQEAKIARLKLENVQGCSPQSAIHIDDDTVIKTEDIQDTL
jgi:hypothetical protein